MNLGVVFSKDLGTVFREIREEIHETVDAQVPAAGRALRVELQRQVLAAGLGVGNANAWRVRIYRNGRGRMPVAFVWSRAPLIMQAFEFGADIVPRTGGRMLAIPTNFNRAGGRRGGKVLVTPQQMLGAKNSFVTPIKGTKRKLWWLRVNKASRIRFSKASKKNPKSVALRQGITDAYVAGRRISDRRRRERAVQFGAVPMFVLSPRERLDKRLDIRGAAERQLSQLAQAIPAGWKGHG